jgi:prepilin-type N-terminal cleavage/methylation domain-containing protein
MSPSNRSLHSGPRRHGFTLVEIMIVVGVVALLSFLAVFVIKKIKERTAHSLLQNNLKQLYQAKEYYFIETGAGGTVGIKQLIAGGYLKPSIEDRLFGSGSLETKMGWHYGRRFVASEPTYAYQGAQPTAGNPPAIAEYYPGPPTSFATTFPASAGQPATATAQTSTPAQSATQAPVTPQPPPGFKAGSTPNAPWVASTPAALAPVREDTPRTLTEAELLQLVGASNPTGGTPNVTGVKVDPSVGTVVKQANGSWVFTPAANFHGSNLNLDVQVANAAGQTTATARLDVTPVTDAPVAKLGVVAEQQVMKFDAAGTGAVMNRNNLQGGGPMSQLAVEFTVIGGPQVQTVGSHGATFISYATTRTNDEFYVWKPEDLTVRLGGHEYATGINTTLDTASHRYTVQWDSATGGLDVFVDGKVAKHLDNIARGTTIPGDGKLVLAQDQDAYGGGFSPNDAFRGQIFNAAMARTRVDAAQLANNNLGNVLHGSNDLIIDIQAQGQGFIDTTGRHQINSQGSIVSANVMVDTAIASPNPGARLRLDTLITAPADTGDKITSTTLSGFAAGTVISDGPQHVHNVTGPGDIINVRDWTVSTLTAQLPVNSRENMDVRLEVTTTGPDGSTATSTSTAPVRFGATKNP